MPVDTFVMDPGDIIDVAQADDVIRRIRQYKKEMGCKKAGVLLIQTRLFGCVYGIVSREEARELMSRYVYDDPDGCGAGEWGLEFYRLSYFKALRERLRGNEEVELPEPKRRKYS